MSKLPLSERKIQVIKSAEPKQTTFEPNRKLRVAAYCRVSTDSKEQETSFDSQVKYYTEKISKNEEWVFVGIYADPAISGTSRKHRTEFNRMLYDCLHGKIDLIITKSMSRFARNQIDSLAVIRMLNGLHPPVRVLFEDDHISSDDLSSEIIITITSMLAEQESVKKSTNVKWGFERRKEQGHYLVPTQNLVGYDKTEAINKDDREIFVVEEEAPIIRAIFIMFLAGYRVTEIAYELTKAGVKTGKGNTTWNSSSVLGILKNERYAGDVRTNKTYVENIWTKKTIKNNGEHDYVYETDHHPAIVSHEEFAMAQKLMASHKYGYDPFVNGGYMLTVIDEGLFKGFIPINIHWAGSDLKEYMEVAGTIEQTSDLLRQGVKIPYYPGFQVIRRQDLGHLGRPALRITPSSMALNTGCVPEIESEFIEILFNPIEKIIAVRPVDEMTPGAVKWKKTKNGKEESTSIGCTAFMSIVYALMGWPKLWNTSILATIYKKNGECVMLFDLSQIEINALPYEKPKPKKQSQETDVFYNIEAMIAQQLELLHNKQDADVYLEEEPEKEELPPPKRIKLHPSGWRDTFGESSEKEAVSCRRYQFATMKEWDISAQGVPVDGFKQQVVYTDDDVQKSIEALQPAREKEE